MDDAAATNKSPYLDMAVDVAAAYVSNNRVAPGELPAFITMIHDALAKVAAGLPLVPEAGPTKPSPAEVRRSIGPDGIVSFLNGKAYKMLRRHLIQNGLDEFTYRQRFGLPADYPMTASVYSTGRSKLAKSLGLGGRVGYRRKATDAAETVAEEPEKAARSPKTPNADAKAPKPLRAKKPT